MYDPTHSGGDLSDKKDERTEKSERTGAMSISAVLGSSDSPKKEDTKLPSLASGDEKRTSAFASSGGDQPYTLPPVQFDGNVVDRRKQNIAPTADSPPSRAEDAVARLKKNQELTSSQTEEDKKQHHHHHHHHHKHHHHHHRDSPSSELEPPKTAHAQVTVDSHDVFDAVKHFPEKRLNSMVYCDLPANGVLFPRLENHLNSTIQVRIPADYMKKTNPSVQHRKLWGTEVYTDDSDLVSILYHGGHLHFASDDQSTNANTIEDEKEKEKEKDGENSDDKDGENNSEKRKSAECENDAIVTVRVLPKLNQYRGSYRNGYNSRTWKTRHDGVSIYVENVRFMQRGRAEDRPVAKKQRIQDWTEQRKVMIALYPKIEVDDERVEQLKQKFQVASET